MGNRKKLPIRVENFEDLRRGDYYYIDKTKFISELLSRMPAVSLITRPRRFGKTLTMSMLKDFFDITKESKDLFQGLHISEHQDICNEWMNQWPVLFITLKTMNRTSYEKNMQEFSYDLAEICEEHRYLLESGNVSDSDKKKFICLMEQNTTESALEHGLPTIMRMLYNHYGKKVILLIDEYDVPLATSNEYGYYRQMVEMIRSIMNRTLKTNPYLKFAVITGCLRVAKESIFTGVNHMAMDSIHVGRYMDSFGFTEQEVQQLVNDMGHEDKQHIIKKWYDGYCFGSNDIYCPWDVINYMDALNYDPNSTPGNYWKNTSHNDIIKKFIGRKDLHVNDKFEILLSGKSIQTKVSEDLTYDFDRSSESNLWSLLYLTGYLTLDKNERRAEIESLRIPNEEIKSIFVDTIIEWFKEDTNQKDLSELFQACWSENIFVVESQISDILFKTISYHDYREDFYHAFLAGIFAGSGYTVKSNRENGLGRSDIVIKNPVTRTAIIFEAKYSETKKDLEKDCKEAIVQIKRNRYDDELKNEGYSKVICYGIAFYKKECRVILGD